MHYTVKSRWLNDIVAGRRRDGDLQHGYYAISLAHTARRSDARPRTDRAARAEDRRRLSLAHLGDPFWTTRLIARFPFGKVAGLDFIHPSAWPEIVRAARLQALFYAAIAGVSVATGSWIAVTCWLIPALIGAPLLRAYLVVEHNGCTHDDNGFTNTRTTLTNPLVRLVMWNMPFHAEHHLLPNIPFHRLPDAHQALRAHMKVITPGYIEANRQVLAGLH